MCFRQDKQFHWLAVIIYVGLLIYGTLYPWQGWRVPSDIGQRLALEHWWIVSYSDIFTNLLIYIPLGFLLARVVTFQSLTIRLLVTFLGGALLSFLLEFLQIYLPSRVPSFLDLAFNALGALIGGGVFIVFPPQSQIYKCLFLLRQTYIRSGALANISLFLLGVWVIYQTLPWMPSLNISSLYQELKQFWYVLTLEFIHIIVSILEVTALGLIAALTLKPDRSTLWQFTVFVSIVLLLKIPVTDPLLYAQDIIGASLGILCFALLCKLPLRMAILSGIIAILGAIVIDELRPEAAIIISGFNWVPFRGHLSGTLIGIIDTLVGAWPFLALSLLVLYLHPKKPRRVLIWGGVGIFAGMFALEWEQQYIAGRYADIIDVVFALLMWWLPWMYPPLRQEMCVAKVRRSFCPIAGGL